MPQFDVLQYFGNQPDIFETYDHLVLATDPEGERIIGILGAKDFVRGSTRFLYLWTAMVVDRYHRTSLFKRINQFFLRQVSERNGGLPPLIVARPTTRWSTTCSAPSARGSGATLYPDLEAPRQSPDMVDLARDVVGTLSANLRLDAETGLIPGGQRSVAPDFFRAWRCPATPGPTTTSSPTSAAATRSSAWSASRPVPNPTCSRGSSGERTRAASDDPWLAALPAAVLYGAWAAYANQDGGLAGMGVAALLQGAASLLATRFGLYLLQCLGRRHALRNARRPCWWCSC